LDAEMACTLRARRTGATGERDLIAQWCHRKLLDEVIYLIDPRRRRNRVVRFFLSRANRNSTHNNLNCTRHSNFVAWQL